MVVPIAAALVAIGLVATLVLSGGDGGSEPASPKGPDKVDLSDIDDPKSTTTRPATTTTEAPAVTTPDGRIVVESESGISWTMGARAEVDDVVSGGSSDPVGQTWQAPVDGTTTEIVDVVRFEGRTFDADAALRTVAKRFDGELSTIEESHIEHAPGRTASFSGVLGGKPVVGYAVAAQVDDEGLVMVTVREGDDLGGLYLDFLPLPSSVMLP